MKPFDLSLWLKDKSRKLVTRDGRPARIVCWDRNTKYWKIVGLVTSPDGSTENPFTYDVNGNESDGCLHDHRNDLFFADDEEELTEFEKAVKQVMWTAYNYDDCSNGKDVDDISNVKATSKSLLDLARKQIEKEITKEVEQKAINNTYAYQNGYENGKYDALKDFPMWKKCDDNLPYSHIGGLNNRYLIKGGYCIKISDLETLQKEQ